jgi:putative ABC transport system permease protein
MIRNYLLASLRILLKQRLYTFINSIGLAIGLATCFLIYTWVQYQTSYDKYFPSAQHTYRVVTQWDNSDEPGRATTYPMVRTRVLSQFPEVEQSTRLFDRGFLGSRTRIANGDKVFTDSKFFYADSTFFEIFPFHILKGDQANLLKKPNAVVLTLETAEKYFGKEDPVGKTLTVGKQEFEVTAVMENIPVNMHFHFDLLASMLAHPWIKMAEENVWSGISFHTYARLKPNTSASSLETKIKNYLNNFPNDNHQIGKTLNLHLQPVQDIHLHSAMGFEMEPNGNVTYVYLFLSIAILVLLVAIINYTNLASARYTQRLKEVGVRKVLGASRSQLIIQFVTESLMITSLAFVIALAIMQLVVPVLRLISQEALFAMDFSQRNILLSFAGITLIIGLLTGLSPALALSAIRPVRLFKANASAPSGGISLRKVLMVSQFTVSIALTICTAITYQQMKFMRDAKLGYQLDHTLVLNIGYSGISEKYASLKSQLLSNRSILGATATSQLPTDIHTEENIDISPSHELGVHCVSVDQDFFKVMNIPVKQGEDLMANMVATDSINQFVLNESAAKAIGWKADDAVNKQMSIRHGNQKRGAIKGVVADFHFQSLHHLVEPLVIEFHPESFQYLLVKVNHEHLSETINFIADQWNRLAGGIPFDYSFLDQDYNKLYQSEQQTSSLFILFAVLAMLISLLGLFGLSAFAVERRTKEIGVRKILGALNSTILMLISKDFLILLLISFLLAVPLGYYFMNTWLAHFAVKVSIGPGLFLVAGLLNFILALLTLSYQSLKIAKTNPVETLRDE